MVVPTPNVEGQRFNTEHTASWHRDGGVLIERFFTADEVKAVVADFEKVFVVPSGGGERLDEKRRGQLGRFSEQQFATFAPVPFDCSPALNLIGVHPALVSLAKELLRAEDVHLYQCQAWAKFTGAADYDQPFHCDFANHTLTVPAEDAADSCVTVLCYFTDVSETHGPAHYVARPDSATVADAAFFGTDDELAQIQVDLSAMARSTASPAGSIFPYSIDVFHRGTNMTEANGRRYAVMACFKRAGDDAVAYHSWASDHHKPWANIFEHATPEQLACFGVQPPGDPFWTALTIERAQRRYPGWDLTPYRSALNRSALNSAALNSAASDRSN